MKINTQIERISIAGATARLSPVGFHVYAKDFLRAGVSLEELNNRFSPVQYYLLARAVELALKAFLSAKGLTLRELASRKYRHDLTKLLETAEGYGLASTVPLEPRHLREIRRAKKYYSEKVFEYPAIFEAINAYPHTPDLDLLRGAAEILVKRTELLCLEAS